MVYSRLRVLSLCMLSQILHGHQHGVFQRGGIISFFPRSRIQSSTSGAAGCDFDSDLVTKHNEEVSSCDPAPPLHFHTVAAVYWGIALKCARTAGTRSISAGIHFPRFLGNCVRCARFAHR